MRQQVAADKDLYSLLDLKFSADSSDIRVAYRRAALLYHPDKGGTKEAFHAIKCAFEILSCSATRHLYNQSYIGQLRQNRRQLPFRCKLSRSNGFAHKASLKRCCSSVDASIPPPKRHRCCSGMEARTSAGQPMVSSLQKQAQNQASCVDDALGHMRVLLQSMSAQQRLAAIQNVSSQVRSALLTFMQKPQKPQNTQPGASIKAAKRSQGYRKMQKHAPVSGCSGVRCLKSSLGTRYRAHLVIKGLRLYTNTSSYEAAIDHHIAFVQMRDAVASESSVDPCIWTNPAKLLRIMQRVLIANNTSETMIDLHVFVYMRATPWLDKNTYIVSPVMQLAQAVSVYGRLLSAQTTSWESLRAEWVCLLQHKKRFQAKGQSQADAENIVDQARARAVTQRFKQAEQGVKRAMKREGLELKKASEVAAREERRVAIAEVKAAALERKQCRQMWQARRKILAQWKDMTMEDIMSNSHPHL